MSSNSSKQRPGNPAKPPPEPQKVVETTMAPAPPPDAPAPTGGGIPISHPSVVDPSVRCELVHDIVSHTLRSGINYLYLGRVDAAPFGGKTLDMKIVLQIAMPLDGFLNSFFMLEATIKKMQMQGIVSPEMIAAGRARYTVKDEGGI